MTLAKVLEPPQQLYKGKITDPKRWELIKLRVGDVVVATPKKSGTTWTQTIAAMLLHGSTTLPDLLTNLSPWWDANFFSAKKNAETMEAQPGPRIIKTHTPLDGLPVWDGVKTISVFRHPAECLLSMRQHLLNDQLTKKHALYAPEAEALRGFLSTRYTPDDCDRDTIESIHRHFKAAHSGRTKDVLMLHYAQMQRDRLGAVKAIDAHLGTQRPEALLHDIAEATSFQSMKSNAMAFAPEAGSGYWKDEVDFFAGGHFGEWSAKLSAGDVDAFDQRLQQLFPDPAERHWIETGMSA